MLDQPGARVLTADPLDASARRRRTLAWWTFVALALVLLPVFVRLSFDFGVTWDEKARHKYGEMIWEYLRGLRGRSDFVEDGGQLYGGLFDTICAAVERYIPADRYVVRHAINATFGWVGIVYCGRLAGRLFGQWAGVVALVLLTISPRYLADSMNNPKDLPFAAITIVALYYISTVSPTWPYLSRSTAAKIVAALAIALNIRAGALMYLGYLGLLVIAYALIERHFSWRRLADTTARLAGMSVAVLVLGTACWPWAQSSPLTRPIEALLGFAKFPYRADMLFGGTIISSEALPKSYAPWWFLVSTPPVVLAGLALASTVGLRARCLPLALIAAVAAVPIVLVIALGSTLYDGVRHLLFVYPLLVVLAAWGWTSCLSEGRPGWVRAMAGGLLFAGIVNVVAFDVRSHPNQTTYFNEIVGGPKGAFGRYPMDYWGNCLLEAVAWSATAAQRSGRPIVISGEPWQLIQLDAERFHQLSFTLPYRGQHQLDVLLARGSKANMEGLANRPGALYRVKTADGAVLCAVFPGPTFAGLEPHLTTPPSDLSAHELLSP